MRMLFRIHQHHAVLVEQLGVAFDDDVEGDGAVPAEAVDIELSSEEGSEASDQPAKRVLAPDAAMKAAFEKVGATILAEWQKSAGADGEAMIRAYRGR